MTDQNIVDLVHTENDAQDKSDDESEEDIPCASAIKNFVEFWVMIDREKTSLKCNDMPTNIVAQLEAQVITSQFSLCRSWKMQDYFKINRTRPVIVV